MQSYDQPRQRPDDPGVIKSLWYGTKNIGLLGALSLGGIRLTQRMQDNIRLTLEAIEHAKRKLNERGDTPKPIFAGRSFDDHFPDHDVIETPDILLAEDKMYKIEDFEEERPTIPDTEYVEYDNELHRQFLGIEYPYEQGNLQDGTRVHREFEREYPGVIKAISGIDKQNIGIVNIKRLHERYEVTIQDFSETGRTETIHFPRSQNGLIVHRGGTWIHNPKIALTPKGAVYYPYGMTAAKDIINNLPSVNWTNRGGATSMAKAIKGSINTTLASLEHGYLPYNTMSAYATPGFYREEAMETVESITDPTMRKRLLGLNRPYEGVRALQGFIDPETHQLNFKIMGKLTVLGGSESALVKGSIKQGPPFGIGPLSPRFKQSAARPNWSAGNRIAPRQYGAAYYASKLGMIPEEFAETLHQNYMEKIPGRLANVGFYYGDVMGTADGSAMFVLQKRGNIHRPDSSLNIHDFNAIKREPIILRGEVLRGENKIIHPSTQRIKSEFIKANPKGGVVQIHKGQILGQDPASGKLIKATESGYLLNYYEEGNVVKMELAYARNLREGWKMTETKSVIDVIATAKDLKGSFKPEDRVLGEHLARFEGNRGIEFILNASGQKHYRGGQFGLGIVQKIIGDLVEIKKHQYFKNEAAYRDMETVTKYRGEMEKFTRGILGVIVGDETASMLNIGFTDDNDIGITIKGKVDELGKYQVTTADSVFRGLVDLEQAYWYANTSNRWDTFMNQIKQVEKRINGITGINYQLTQTLEDTSKLSEESPKNLAAFIFHGKDSKPGKLVFANITTLVTSHEVNSYDLSRVSRSFRGPTGYGGLKITANMRRDYSQMGLRHMTRYIDTLRDYRMTYILDKYHSPDHFLLKSEKFGGPKERAIRIGKRKMNVKLLDLELQGSDILSRLAEQDETENILRIYKGFKIAKGDLSNLPGVVGEEIYEDFAKKGILNLGSLIENGQLALRGNSISLVPEDLMHKYMKLINQAGPHQKVYLKLPFSVNVNGTSGDMVPLMSQDPSDMFKLMATSDRNALPGVNEYKNTFYTMSSFGRAQMQYIREVAHITEQYKQLKGSEYGRKRLQAELENATIAMNRMVKTAFSGKNSPGIKAITEVRAPLTFQGRLHSAEDIALDAIGIHQDDMVKLLTGGDMQTFEEVQSFTKFRQEIDNLSHLISPDDIEKFDRSKLSSSTTRLAKSNYYQRSLKRYLGEDSAAEITETLKSASGVGGVTEDYKRAVSNLRNMLSKAKIQVNEKGFKYLRAHEIIEQMRNGRVKFAVETERFPHTGPGSARTFQLQIHNRPGSTFGARKMLSNKQFYKTTGQLYVNPLSALAFRADFDRDFASIMLTAVDKLDDIDKSLATKLGINLKKTKGIKFSESLGLNQDAITHLSDDALEALIQRNAFVEIDGELKPATATAYTMMSAIEDSKVESHFDKVEIDKYLDDLADQMLPNSYTKEEKIRIKKDIHDKTYRRMFELHGINEIQGDKRVPLFILAKRSEKAIELKPKTQAGVEAKIAELYPERLFEKIRGLSDEDYRVFNEVTNKGHHALASFQHDIIEREVDRFGEMKLDVSKAHKINEALQMISESFATTERQKAYFYRLGSDIIEQNTISIKHGTPAYLDSIISMIKKLGGNRGSTLLQGIEEYKNLIDANLDLMFSDKDRREIIKWGFADEKTKNISYTKYQSYLETKERVIGELTDAHHSAMDETLRSMAGESMSVINIRDKYNNHINGRMQNIMIGEKSLASIESSIPDWMYDRGMVYEAVIRAKESRENAQKFRSMASTSDSIWHGIHEEMARKMKLYREMYGEDFTRHPHYQAMFGFLGSEDYNMIDMVHAMGKEAMATGYMETPLWTDTLPGRAASFIFGIKDTKMRRFNAEEARGKFEVLQRRELNEIRTMKKAAFNSGVSMRGGKLVRSTLSNAGQASLEALEGRLLRDVGKTKIGSILTGLFVGVVAGQMFNQGTSGYAVPDLKDINGLGGEYYENKGGIMGTETEAFLSPRPAKVVPLYKEDQLRWKYLEDEVNIRDASRYDTQVTAHRSRYRGIVVR